MGVRREPLSALVLAGGKSKRLGRDKARIPLEGCSMLERTVGLARLYCEKVFLSGRDSCEEGLDIPWIPDEHPGQGPIGGIVAGLKATGGPLLVLACDLPLLDERTLERLIMGREERPETALMTTFHQPETGYIEALVAVYEPGAEQVLREAMASGVHKLSQAVPPALRHHLPYGHDEAGVFFNLNYPADLAMLRRFRPEVGEAAPADSEQGVAGTNGERA